MKPRRPIGRFRDNERGTPLVEFGLILPMLMALTFGVLEFSLVAFKFHQATEATRRIARTTTLYVPMPSYDDLIDGTEYTCSSAGGTVTCTAAANATLTSDAPFTAALATAQNILADIGEGNLRISYQMSDLDVPPDVEALVKPQITVSLVNVTHEYLLLSAIPGLPDSLDFPPFTTTLIGPGY